MNYLYIRTLHKRGPYFVLIWFNLMANYNDDLFACMTSQATVKAVALKKDLTEVVTKVRPWDKVRNVTKNGYVQNHTVVEPAKSTTVWDEAYAER